MSLKKAYSQVDQKQCILDSQTFTLDQVLVPMMTLNPIEPVTLALAGTIPTLIHAGITIASHSFQLLLVALVEAEYITSTLSGTKTTTSPCGASIN